MSHLFLNPRLYKALGEFDVLQGIFGGRIGTHENTKVALEAEARGDYTKALTLYSEVGIQCTRRV